MAQKNLLQIKTWDSRKPSVRLILVLAALSALIFGWYSVRRQIGNMLAELTLPTDPNAENTAALALNFSPDDPLANLLAANIEKDKFSLDESPENSVEGFKTVVRLSPNDYRWWIQIGRAFEQADKPENAEKAFLRAIELAPNYTIPRWQAGNFYLRQGREAEAFAQLNKAAENDAVYREQIFSIVWDFYEKDTGKLEQLAGNSPASRMTLAKFYAAKERAEDSLRIWNTLSDEEKKENKIVAELIARALFDKRFYQSAIQFVNQLEIEPDAKIETVQNAGFESPISDAKDAYFGWRVSTAEKAEVKLDPNQKREGKRSLRVLLNGFQGVELNSLYQIIAVQPSARYRLGFWLRTENLKSAGLPNLEIINPNDNRIITAGKPFPLGTNDWQQFQIEFTAPEKVEGAALRTARAYCGNACPIVGTFWLDDFKLERLK